MHLYSAALDVLVLVRAVNKHRQLFGPDFLGSVSKYKEHRVDHVGFPTAVWTDDAGKALESEGRGALKNRFCFLKHK